MLILLASQEKLSALISDALRFIVRLRPDDNPAHHHHSQHSRPSFPWCRLALCDDGDDVGSVLQYTTFPITIIF